MTDMVRGADMIAVVKVTVTRRLPREQFLHPHHWEEITSTVVTPIEGTAASNLVFFVPRSLPNVPKRWEPKVNPGGTYLVFLEKRSMRLEVWNYFLACRPVTDGKLEWYADYLSATPSPSGGFPDMPPDRIALSTQAVESVVQQIKATLNKEVTQ
jgi:hypothetical protein